MNITQQFIAEKNPWWEAREFLRRDEYLVTLRQMRYQYQHPLLQEFPIGKAGVILLRGPRRVGKSTLVKLIMERLLYKEKIEPLAVCYFSGEYLADFKELYEMLITYLDYVKPRTTGHLYLFLDEISFVKEWQRAVKVLWDEGKLKRTTMLLTGSSHVDLLYSYERLPDRQGNLAKTDYLFLPLSFRDFVRLLHPKLKPSLQQLPELQKLLSDYVITGGFLQNINHYVQHGLLESARVKTYLKWVEGDFHQFGKSEHSLYAIIRELFRVMQTPVSIYEITKGSGLTAHRTVGEYLDLLEKMYCIKQVSYWSVDERKSYPAKNKKYYFIDPFVLNAFLAKVEQATEESFTFVTNRIKQVDYWTMMAENIVADALSRDEEPLYYGRLGKDQEIDFVKPARKRIEYVEVKYQTSVKSGDFGYSGRLPKGPCLTVVTKQDYFAGDRIRLIPLPLWLCF